MQAISGAGYPGVASMDINANVIPYIGGEEEKMQVETQKILGELRRRAIEPLAAQVSAHCNRVPVVDGHTDRRLREARATSRGRGRYPQAYDTYRGVPAGTQAAERAERPVIYMEQQDRPQPRRDAERENGMVVFVGRLRALSRLRLEVHRLRPQHRPRRCRCRGTQRAN